MNPTRELELISTDDLEGEHEALDNEIKQGFYPLDENTVHNLGPLILVFIVIHSKGRLDSKYSHFNAASELINEHEGLRDALIEGFKSGFRRVRLCKLLRTSDGGTATDVTQNLEAEKISAEEGWQAPFVGRAADVLWKHICHVSTRLDDEKRASKVTDRRYYARYCPILQSSGMGKSRTVEEMSRSHFVIPIVLREPNSNGYPPSDHQVYEYFSQHNTQYDVFTRYCGFLHALFLEAASVLEKFEEPVDSFRQYMQKDMKFRSHGENRERFYKNVVTAAGSHVGLYTSYFHDSQDPSDTCSDNALRDDGFPLRGAFSKLSVAVRRNTAPEDVSSKYQRVSEPCILVAFDEIDTLTGKNAVLNAGTRFTELRRVIRGLLDESFFVLFLSTSGAAFDITPTPSRDKSDRMIREGNVLLPFCDVGFDQRAIFLNFSGPVFLSKVTAMEHLRSYGRPLWTCCSYNDKQIMKFAVDKLLGGAVDTHGEGLSTPQKLTCLAQRIPIEFLSTTYSPLVSDQQKELIRSHLRVLLKIEDDLETMVTTSPSGPILSEAAYVLMTSGVHRFCPPTALQDILDGFAVNKGELGELLVALLFILARDTTVGPADNFGLPPSGRRWCHVPELLSALFCTPSASGSPVVDVKAATGWRFSGADVNPDGRSLAEVFRDSKAYFTHFIKAQEKKLVRVEFLMRLMARGAALLCANGQSAVDGIIPFLLKGDEIRRDNIGAIIFQVKNNKRYSHVPNAALLSGMNPQTVSHLDDIPIIRIFFALAATRSALKLVTHTSPGKDETSYTSYDFWAAGFSPAVFAPMGKEEATWISILQKSKAWEDIYKSEVSDSEELRRTMNPGAANSEEHWGNWCDYPKV